MSVLRSPWVSQKSAGYRLNEMMGPWHLAVIASVVFTIGCDFSSKTPTGPGETYPAVIKDSADRRARAEREWRRMLDAYSVPQTPPDLYPITYTPRSLLGVSGGIQLSAIKSQLGTDDLALRELARSFMSRWRDLVAVDPSTLSLLGASVTPAASHFTYRQGNYPFDVVGGYGEMTLTLSSDGRIEQLDDRFIPLVDLPARPAVERDAAVTRLVGQTVSFTDPAGRQEQVQVTERAQVSVRQPVVVPLEKGDSIEIHLAWEIAVGKPEVCMVYMDAINGLLLKATPKPQP